MGYGWGGTTVFIYFSKPSESTMLAWPPYSPRGNLGGPVSNFPRTQPKPLCGRGRFGLSHERLFRGTAVRYSMSQDRHAADGLADANAYYYAT